MAERFTGWDRFGGVDERVDPRGALDRLSEGGQLVPGDADCPPPA